MKILANRREALAALASTVLTGTLPVQTVALNSAQPLDGDALAELKGLRTGTMQRLLVRKEGIPMPNVPLQNEYGHEMTLADWRGKVLVMKFWTTWCGFCRKSMPSLDRLQGMLGGEDFDVLAVNIEDDGIAKVREYYDSMGLTNLAVIVDEGGVLASEARVMGVPTAMLVDRAGNEVALLSGAMQWDTEEVLQFMNRMIELG